MRNEWGVWGEMIKDLSSAKRQAEAAERARQMRALYDFMAKVREEAKRPAPAPTYRYFVDDTEVYGESDVDFLRSLGIAAEGV